MASRFLVTSLCFFFTGLFSFASAINLNVAFLQSVESTSNLLHVEDALNSEGQFEEVINSSLLSFTIDEELASIKGFLDLDLKYIDYENNLSRDTTRNTLSSEMLWTISRGYYSWYFKDRYSQIRDDPTENLNSNNTQNVNEFVTGPKFEWKIGISHLTVESFLSNYTYSENNNDNTSIASKVSWGKSITGGMSIYVQYSTMFLTYDESDFLEDYDQSTVGLNFRYARSVNSLDVFLGKTYLNPGDVDKKTFETSSVVFKRQISELNYFSASYSKKLSNQNTSIDSEVVSLSGPVVRERSNIKYHKELSGYSMDIKYTERNSSIEGVDSVDKSVEREISISREVAARSQIRVLYREVQSQLISVGGGFKDSTYVAKLEYKKRLNNKLSLLVFVSETLNESETVSRQYVDNRIGLTLSISR